MAEAARALKERFGPRRVVLFGSLAHQAWYTPSADVDLAVEGLEEGTFWEAWALVEAIIPDRKVDFVEIELASDSLRAAIEEHGRAL